VNSRCRTASPCRNSIRAVRILVGSYNSARTPMSNVVPPPNRAPAQRQEDVQTCRFDVHRYHVSNKRPSRTKTARSRAGWRQPTSAVHVAVAEWTTAGTAGSGDATPTDGQVNKRRRNAAGTHAAEWAGRRRIPRSPQRSAVSNKCPLTSRLKYQRFQENVPDDSTLENA